MTRRGGKFHPLSLAQFKFQPLANRALAASFSSLKCSARKRTGAQGVDIRHYRPMIYAFRDCISPFASLSSKFIIAKERETHFNTGISPSSFSLSPSYEATRQPSLRLSFILPHPLPPPSFPFPAFLRLPPNHEWNESLGADYNV